MATKTFTDWPDRNHEGTHIPIARRPRKKIRIRKYSIIDLTGKLIKAIIIATAFVVVMGSLENAIDAIARM